MQWNADGLNPKIDEFRKFVRKEKIDVVLVQETKLKPPTKLRPVKITLLLCGGQLATNTP